MTVGRFSLDLHGHLLAHEQLSAQLIADAIRLPDLPEFEDVTES